MSGGRLNRPRALLFAGAFAVAGCAGGGHRPAAKSADSDAPMIMNVGGALIEIQKDALAFPESTGRFHGWLGYALGRRIWADSKFRERFPSERQYRYSFEEELDARQSAEKIWAELRDKDHFTDRYFGELHGIAAAGFFREYIWYCVPHPAWSRPDGLRQDAFAGWLSSNLPDHQVETWVTVTGAGSGARVVLGAQPHPPTRCQVTPDS